MVQLSNYLRRRKILIEKRRNLIEQLGLKTSRSLQQIAKHWCDFFTPFVFQINYNNNELLNSRQIIMKQVVSDASRDKRKQKARKQNGGHPGEGY